MLSYAGYVKLGLGLTLVNGKPLTAVRSFTAIGRPASAQCNTSITTAANLPAFYALLHVSSVLRRHLRCLGSNMIWQGKMVLKFSCCSAWHGDLQSSTAAAVPATCRTGSP
jgi:hypothetical protein